VYKPATTVYPCPGISLNLSYSTVSWSYLNLNLGNISPSNNLSLDYSGL